MLSARQKKQLTQSSTYVARQKNQLQVTQQANYHMPRAKNSINITKQNRICLSAKKSTNVTK